MTRDSDELVDLFENAPIGIHWVGPDGIILRANRAELERMGYARGEYVGRHIAEFHVDRALIDDVLRRLARGEAVHDCEVRLRAKDGSVRHAVTDFSVRWEDDRVVHVHGFTRDVGDLLKREQRARDEYLATLSHALRTPLNAVLGWTMMLRGGTLDAATTARALDVIERNTRAQTQLIERLADVAPRATDPAASARARTAPASLAGVRVLVVDGAGEAPDLERLLTSGDAEVRRVQTVSEAVDALATWRADVVVSEGGLPGEDRSRLLSAGFQLRTPGPIEPADLVAIAARLAGRLAFTSDPHAKGRA